LPNNRYKRGAGAERELLKIFNDMNWAVIRSSGSGVNALSPDVVVIRNKICMAFECKHWNRGSLALDAEQYQKLLEWERNSDSLTFVAWKVSYKGWYFIKLDEFTKTEKNYNITLKKVFEINRVLESILPIEAVSSVSAGAPKA
jgi:holliday junction resolvase Hjr